jgi:hypothetical protein
MPRSPSPITSAALERQVVRLHRLSSAAGKRTFDVAQRNSALGQRPGDEGETAGISASPKSVRRRRAVMNSLAARDNLVRLFWGAAIGAARFANVRGHWRTSRLDRLMSALPSAPDTATSACDLRKAPKRRSPPHSITAGHTGSRGKHCNPGRHRGMSEKCQKRS